MRTHSSPVGRPPLGGDGLDPKTFRQWSGTSLPERGKPCAEPAGELRARAYPLRWPQALRLRTAPLSLNIIGVNERLPHPRITSRIGDRTTRLDLHAAGDGAHHKEDDNTRTSARSNAARAPAPVASTDSAVAVDNTTAGAPNACRAAKQPGSHEHTTQHGHDSSRRPDAAALPQPGHRSRRSDQQRCEMIGGARVQQRENHHTTAAATLHPRTAKHACLLGRGKPSGGSS